MKGNSDEVFEKRFSEKEAMDIFVDLVERGDLSDQNLEVKHIHRGYNIKQISPSNFQISVERHPHLFGSPSIGKPSSAYATLKHTYELDAETRKVKLIDEKVIDIKIDYYALAEEYIIPDGESLWLNGKEENKLANLGTEEEVVSFAKDLFKIQGIDQPAWDLFTTDYELPADFKEKLIYELKDVFIHAVIEEWKWLKRNPDWKYW